MDCSCAHDKLGPYLDSELNADEAGALDAHLRACPACMAELTRLRVLIDQLAAAKAADAQVHAPAEVWTRVERRWSASAKRPVAVRFWRQPMAAAASLALMIGAGALVAVWVNRTAEPASAAMVDYSVLLDGVAQDVDAAVARFLKHYHAVTIEPETARAATGLDFDLPAELPGGFRREGVYRLRFGASTGVAGRYRRGNEPLVVFFHPPMERTQMGIHRQSCCHVAGCEGQRVEVGPWRLVHFTDPTTCHCLLSKLDDEAAQTAVFAAVAPSFPREAQTRPGP